MRALVLSNMRPSPERPGRGIFVRDQVAALRRLGGLDLELIEAPPGARALAGLTRRLRRERGFDVVHAHFGLTAWPALAVPDRPRRVVTLHGNDLQHPRTRRITLAVLGRMDLAATVSASLAEAIPGAGRERRVAVLPCGADLERFRPVPRREARAALGLTADEPFALFTHDPARTVKRADLARAATQAAGGRLVTLGDVTPDAMALWINAANAVLVPSDFEGFGLAVVEALACDVPVLATPAGAHPVVLAGVPGTLCEPFELERWSSVLRGHLADPDPRVQGRGRASLFGADAMARRVAVAWRALVAQPDGAQRRSTL